MSKITAIVLAAGKGSRMNSEIKKQFMEVDSKPIILYSLLTFEQSIVDEIVLVTSEEDKKYCKKEIVDKYGLKKVSTIVSGGKERYDSVLNGLKVANGEYVLIHDGARPFVTDEIINRCIDGLKDENACIVGMPVKDTIKIVDENQNVVSTPNRKSLWMTQTPQGFRKNLIMEAYKNINFSKAGNITDDAMIVENFTDSKVKFVAGSYENIKITTEDDITYMNSCIKNKD